jgi:hypothetical protein
VNQRLSGSSTAGNALALAESLLKRMIGRLKPAGAAEILAGIDARSGADQLRRSLN